MALQTAGLSKPYALISFLFIGHPKLVCTNPHNQYSRAFPPTSVQLGGAWPPCVFWITDRTCSATFAAVGESFACDMFARAVMPADQGRYRLDADS